MKKYIDKPVGSVPHLCASCQDVRRFNSKHISVVQRNWRLKPYCVPYGYVIECDQCGSRNMCRGSFLDGSDEFQDQSSDLYTDLIELRGEEDSLVHLADAYRNASVGMIGDESSWKLVLYAMDYLHKELQAPKHNELIRTRTTLTRIAIWLVGLFCCMLFPSMLLLLLTDFAGLPDDGVMAGIAVILGMILPTAWTIYSLIAFWKEFTAKMREERKIKQMPTRFAYMLRGLSVDGPTLDRAFDLGREYGLLTSTMNPLDVLKAHCKVLVE